MQSVAPRGPALFGVFFPITVVKCRSRTVPIGYGARKFSFRYRRLTAVIGRMRVALVSGLHGSPSATRSEPQYGLRQP